MYQLQFVGLLTGGVTRQKQQISEKKGDVTQQYISYRQRCICRGYSGALILVLLWYVHCDAVLVEITFLPIAVYCDEVAVHL